MNHSYRLSSPRARIACFANQRYTPTITALPVDLRGIVSPPTVWFEARPLWRTRQLRLRMPPSGLGSHTVAGHVMGRSRHTVASWPFIAAIWSSATPQSANSGTGTTWSAWSARWRRNRAATWPAAVSTSCRDSALTNGSATTSMSRACVGRNKSVAMLLHEVSVPRSVPKSTSKVRPGRDPAVVSSTPSRLSNCARSHAVPLPIGRRRPRDVVGLDCIDAL